MGIYCGCENEVEVFCRGILDQDNRATGFAYLDEVSSDERDWKRFDGHCGGQSSGSQEWGGMKIRI